MTSAAGNAPRLAGFTTEELQTIEAALEGLEAPLPAALFEEISNEIAWRTGAPLRVPADPET